MKSHLRKLALTSVCSLSAFALLAPAAFAQAGNVFTEPAMTYQLTTGWFQGRQTFYYDFGSNSAINSDASKVIPAPIYAFATGMDANGNPQLVPGQHNVIDAVPGDPGYSDLWVVNLVMVPADYQANTIKSVDDINKSGYKVEQTSMMVDCPVVPLNSKLAEPNPASGSTDTTKGWYKGQEVQYFDFGASPDFTVPIYAFATGMDANGNPQMVPGQHNIIDDLPGSPDYSPFWDVQLVIVPAGYQANSITSAAQIKASGFQVIEPNKVVNCPVVRTDDAVTGNLGPVMAGTAGAPGASGTPAPQAGGATPGMPHTGGGPQDENLPLWLALAGVALISGVTARRLSHRGARAHGR
jgi:hypothetical protein